jgi:hypothetical protein
VSAATTPTPWWVRIERSTGDVDAFGPYPHQGAARHAMNHAPLIDAECEQDAYDCWVSDDEPAPADRVLIDLDDPDHTGRTGGQTTPATLEPQ